MHPEQPRSLGHGQRGVDRSIRERGWHPVVTGSLEEM
jgi:hypothetical protein